MAQSKSSRGLHGAHRAHSGVAVTFRKQKGTKARLAEHQTAGRKDFSRGKKKVNFEPFVSKNQITQIVNLLL